jgi:hypothetical protein
VAIKMVMVRILPAIAPLVAAGWLGIF